MPNPYRYMIARDGLRDVWTITIRENETADQAERRMKDIRGVLWKWDGIVQLAISDRPSKTATKLD